MEYPNLAKVGNIEAYIHEPRDVKFNGLVITPELVLKLYSMAKNAHPGHKTLKDTRDFLESEIESRRISPLSGLGFAILSEDMINVARWDKKCPIVLRNQLYEYEERIETSRQLDIRDIGCFCVWELGIVNHERNAWIEYLNSERRNPDRTDYLLNVIEGDI